MSEQNPQIGQPGAQQQVKVNVKDDKAHHTYSNMSQVVMGPQAEEVIMDLGSMQHDPTHQGEFMMDITARVFMNVYAAKRLALSLSQAVQRYEQQFGPVELDIRRRMKQPG